jgi:hypothetical protein
MPHGVTTHPCSMHAVVDASPQLDLLLVLLQRQNAGDAVGG